MKMTSFLFLAFCFSTTRILAQNSDEKAVSAAVEALRLALISGEEKMLRDITANELSYGHSSGKIEDQAVFIERLVSGNSDFKTITLSDQSIKIVDNTAIVRHRLVAETNDNGTPGNPNLSVLLIFQKQKGTWKLLARQATKL